MNNKNFVYMFLFLVCLSVVSATITFNDPTPTASQFLRTTTVDANASSDLDAVSNVTLTLTLNGRTVATGFLASDSATLTASNLQSGAYTLTAVGRNDTASDTATRSFTISPCNTSEGYLWGIILLVFIVGLVYFAYDGFFNGNGLSIAFLIMLTVVTVIVSSFALSVLRTLC